MSRNVLLLIIVVLLFGGGAWLYMNSQRSATIMPTVTETSPQVVTITLATQNDSGQIGSAVLSEADGNVTVTVTMSGGAMNTPQPAHIHVGACPDVGAVKYPLTNVVNGRSVTVLNTTLAQLKSELPLGLNVHKSVAEASVYTACGDLEL